MRRVFLALTCVVCTAAAAAVAGTPLGTAFTYQGQLKNSGVPANGIFDMRFTLYDDASVVVAGPICGAGYGENVQVTDGLFTVVLDFGAVFNGDNRQLEIAVRADPTSGIACGTLTPAYTTLSPRQKLTLTPYAARSLAPWVTSGTAISYSAGNVGIGTTLPGKKLQVGDTSVPNSEGMIQLQSRSGTGASTRTWGIGVPETDEVTTGPGYSFVIDDTQLGTTPEFMVKWGTGNVGIGTTTPLGALHAVSTSSDAVIATTNATGKSGVFASHTATTGVADGVYGRSDSTSGRGTVGWATAPTGTTYGVYGRSDSTQGNAGIFFGSGPDAVYVENWGTGRGIQAFAPSDTAIWGRTTTGYAGVHGDNAGAGIGVYGYSAGGDGVYGRTASTSGRGTVGWATAPTGTTYGVYGRSDSSTGYGGYFEGRGYFSGNVGIGTSDPDARLRVAGGDVKLDSGKSLTSTGRLHIQSDPADDILFLNPWHGTVYVGGGGGGSGTLSVGVLEIRGGADLAEPFDVSGSEVEPGMVVVIDADQPGKLKLSAKAYDRTVAGVVSGAGRVQSGLVMGQQGSVAYGKQNVALTGRVYCWCDASTGAIQPGDLLTTSDTSGHAMKAADRERAHGTIIGKAMTTLPQGERGLVLVLVNLQ